MSYSTTALQFIAGAIVGYFLVPEAMILGEHAGQKLSDMDESSPFREVGAY